MNTYKFSVYLFTFFILTTLLSCNQGSIVEEKEAETRTPVTVTGVSNEQVEEMIELSATSVFQVKDNLKSNLSGYIDAHIKLGDFVKQSDLLFTIKTKEATALENDTMKNKLVFSGISKVVSPIAGIITTLSKQTGDYVQEGEDIAVVAKQSSLVFILEVPYELKKYIKIGSSCNIELSSDEVITGTISSEMPTVDAVSQTQNYVVKPISSKTLPENLIAKIEIVKSVKTKAQTLPKEAVLTDESQTEWWVMKLVSDSVAIKVPVTKGIVSGNKVEIIEPVFDINDRIIVSGNYGLADTAKVLIQK